MGVHYGSKECATLFHSNRFANCTLEADIYISCLVDIRNAKDAVYTSSVCSAVEAGGVWSNNIDIANLSPACAQFMESCPQNPMSSRTITIGALSHRVESCDEDF